MKHEHAAIEPHRQLAGYEPRAGHCVLRVPRCSAHILGSWAERYSCEIKIPSSWSALMQPFLAAGRARPCGSEKRNNLTLCGGPALQVVMEERKLGA